MERPSSKQPIAVFDNVSKSLGDTRALDSLTLSFPGEGGAAIVGESGSGKSTLLELLIGLLKPDRGSINALGEPIDYANIERYRRRIGYAVQDTGLFPHLSVADNIMLPGRLAGHADSDRELRCHELATMMNLEPETLARYPLELSGGQQQRAGICRAMILKPQLLLLDEPFSGLDIVTRREIYERFLNLTQQDGTSYLLVTHDLSEAAELCDHLSILRNGRLIQQGAAGAVLRQPDHPYVEKMIQAQLGHSRALA